MISLSSISSGRQGAQEEASIKQEGVAAVYYQPQPTDRPVYHQLDYQQSVGRADGSVGETEAPVSQSEEVRVNLPDHVSSVRDLRRGFPDDDDTPNLGSPPEVLE